MMGYLRRRLCWMWSCIGGDPSTIQLDGSRSMGTVSTFETIHSNLRYGEDIIELPRRQHHCCIDVKDEQPYNSSILSLNSSNNSTDEDYIHNRVITCLTLVENSKSDLKPWNNQLNSILLQTGQVEGTRSKLMESKRSNFKHKGWQSLKKNPTETTKSALSKMNKNQPGSQANSKTKTTDVRSPKKQTISTASRKISSVSAKRKSRWSPVAHRTMSIAVPKKHIHLKFVISFN